MARRVDQFTWEFGRDTYPDFDSFLAAFTKYNHRMLGIEPPIEDFPLSESPSVYLQWIGVLREFDQELRTLITSRNGGPLSFLEFMFLANNVIHRTLVGQTDVFYEGLKEADEVEGVACFELRQGEFSTAEKEFVEPMPDDVNLLGDDTYEHTVPYEPDIQSALDKLRAQVFVSGEFNGAQFDPATPEEALELAEEEGTRSILDILKVAEQPDFCCAAPLSPDELRQYFGTTHPTVDDLTRSPDFGEEVERGHCRYVILYEHDKPTQIYFIGVAFD